MKTKRDAFDFCNAFYLFYKSIYKLNDRIVDPRKLKEWVSRKFYPVQMHDSHEFMMYLFSSL